MNAARLRMKDDAPKVTADEKKSGDALSSCTAVTRISGCTMPNEAISPVCAWLRVDAMRSNKCTPATFSGIQGASCDCFGHEEQLFWSATRAGSNQAKHASDSMSGGCWGAFRPLNSACCHPLQLVPSTEFLTCSRRDCLLWTCVRHPSSIIGRSNAIDQEFARRRL